MKQVIRTIGLGVCTLALSSSVVPAQERATRSFQARDITFSVTNIQLKAAFLSTLAEAWGKTKW